MSAERGSRRTGVQMPWELLVTAGLGLWFTVTAASQHPNIVFDRFRDYDRSSILIPNWRFFAPEPAQHDFHLLHRVLTADGVQTPWKETFQFTPRIWMHAVWYPEQRRDKAIFDVCMDLLGLLEAPGIEVTRIPAYQLLLDFVEVAVRRDFAGRELPQGFQFTITRYTGYDHEQDPDVIIASPFVPLNVDRG